MEAARIPCHWTTQILKFKIVQNWAMNNEGVTCARRRRSERRWWILEWSSGQQKRRICLCPIPDDGPFHPGVAKPYSALAAHLGDKWPSSPCEVTLLATYNLAIQAFFAPASGESVAASTTLAFGSR